MKKFNVLLIDDEPEMLEMLEFMLKEEDYNIITAISAKNALKIMGKKRVDLIMCDNRMPEVLGIDFLKMVKTKYPDAIRILMTGFPETRIFKDAINEGEVYKIITKPIDIDNMKIVLKRALEHYESIQENKRLLEELENKVIIRTKELKQSEEKYGVLVENATECIYLLDLEGKLLHINRGCIELNEFSNPDEIIGKYFYEIVDKEYKKRVKDILAKCKKGESFLNYEYRSATEKGNIKWWELNLVPIRTEDRKIINILGVSRDITEKKKYEHQVARLDRLASLGTLSAGIAHEIRNPLSFIKINLQTVKRAYKDEFLGESIGNALEGVENIEKIIENTLQFAKPAEPNFSEEDINLIINSVLLLMKPEFEKKNVTVKLSLYEKLPILKIDPKQITQIFINLLNNAIQAVEPDGGIMIRSYFKKGKKTDSVAVDISDNGSGIPDDKLKYIFDPFFTTKPKGTGLGLSIVQNILKMHNADIFIESKINEGTKVSLEFPLKRIKRDEI